MDHSEMQTAELRQALAEMLKENRFEEANLQTFLAQSEYRDLEALIVEFLAEGDPATLINAAREKYAALKA